MSVRPLPAVPLGPIPASVTAFRNGSTFLNTQHKRPCQGLSKADCDKCGCQFVGAYLRKSGKFAKESCRKSKRSKKYARALPRTQRGVASAMGKLMSRKSYTNVNHPDHAKAVSRYNRLSNKLEKLNARAAAKARKM